MLGEQEQAVFETVREHGPSTVRQVFERFGAPRGLAYTTVATMLERLHEKGLLLRTKAGRTIVYRTSRGASSTLKSSVRDIMARALDLDPLPAVAALVDAVEDVDPSLLDRLAEEVARRRGRRGP